VRWLVTCSLVLALVLATGASAQPLRTGFHDPDTFRSPSSERAFTRARSAGASVVRIALHWYTVASERPADADNPNDPAYVWDAIDRQVTNAVQARLEPILGVSSAPPWARGAAVGLRGSWPSPTRYAEFARAAARRYSGSFTPADGNNPLPRVKYWQAWNEPNASRFLNPQRVNGRPVSPAHYRKMLNAFADAVHGVARSNRVVAGTTGPFGHDSPDIQVVAPLVFMSDLLCVSMQPPHRKTCSQHTRFDIWAHNPYSNGGPNRHAYSPADVSIGDLPEMRSLLVAAKRRGTVTSSGTPEFWVNEISWETKPPDPRGVPAALQARWVSEALYRMWTAGVSSVVWWRLQDDPLRTSPYQSGVFTAAGKAKLSLTAFRFPFVAFRGDGGVTVWGRTPWGDRANVIVQRRAGGRWVSVARLRTDRYGIFSKRLPPAAVATATTALRAQLAGQRQYSLPFSLTIPPPYQTTAFGCGGIIRC